MIPGYLMHCRGNSCSQVGRMLLSGVDNYSMSSSLLLMSSAVFCFHHCPLADLSFIMLTANSIIHELLNESLLLSHPSCCQCEESHRSSYQLTHTQNYSTGLCLQNLLTAGHFIILFSCVTFIWQVLWRYLETSTLVMECFWIIYGWLKDKSRYYSCCWEHHRWSAPDTANDGPGQPIWTTEFSYLGGLLNQHCDSLLFTMGHWKQSCRENTVMLFSILVLVPLRSKTL